VPLLPCLDVAAYEYIRLRTCTFIFTNQKKVHRIHENGIDGTFSFTRAAGISCTYARVCVEICVNIKIEYNNYLFLEVIFLLQSSYEKNPINIK